jgi:leucyl-tRNA synthetase
LEHEDSIFSGANWPSYDVKLTMADEIDIAVQVNGRLRATIRLPRGANEEEVKTKALADIAVQRHLGEKELYKSILVPDRLINLVVR